MAATGGGSSGSGSGGGSAPNSPSWWVPIITTAIITALLSGFVSFMASSHQNNQEIQRRQTDSIATYISQSEGYLRVTQGLQMCDVMSGKSTDSMENINAQSQKLFGAFGAAQMSTGQIEDEVVVNAFTDVYTATIHMNSVLSLERTYAGGPENFQDACNEAQENFDAAFVRLNSAQGTLTQVAKTL